MTQDEPTSGPVPEAQAVTAQRVKSVKGTKGDEMREARIKAALKANIARRKAQARARDEEEASDD